MRDSDRTYALADDGSASLRVCEGNETSNLPATWEVEDDRLRLLVDPTGIDVSELWGLRQCEALTGALLYRVDE